MKIFKQTICAVICAVLVLTSFAAVFAENEPPITVLLDGKPVSFDVQPQLINSRTMVPMRAIFEALGATVEWNEASQSVTSKKDNKVIVMQVNNPVMTVSGTSVTLDSPPVVVSDRTLVPVRAISEALGCSVGWDEASQTVTITSSASSAPAGVTANSAQYPSFGEFAGIEPTKQENNGDSQNYSYTADKDTLNKYADMLVSDYGFYEVNNDLISNYSAAGIFIRRLENWKTYNVSISLTVIGDSSSADVAVYTDGIYSTITPDKFISYTDCTGIQEIDNNEGLGTHIYPLDTDSLRKYLMALKNDYGFEIKNEKSGNTYFFTVIKGATRVMSITVDADLMEIWISY